MLRLGFVWIYALSTVCASTVGANAALRCYRKSCMETEYDIRKAVCCEDRIHPGTGLSCCGERAFNPAAATCCTVRHGHTVSANVTEGLSQGVSACCGFKAYNSLNELCCQTTVVVKPAPKAQCCGKDAFVNDEQICCGPSHNKRIMTRRSSHHQCCGRDQYDTQTECCCWRNDAFEIHDKKDSTCCVKEEEALDDAEQMLCGPSRNRTILTRRSSHHQCCGHDQYDTQTECCCWRNDALEIHPKKSSCCEKETEALDDAKQMLCGPSHNRTILTRRSSHHQCCGHDQYDTQTECCCWRNDALEIHPKKSSCCEKETGVPQQKPVPQPVCAEPQSSLCGSSCYNPNEFRCCERHQTRHAPGGCDSAPTVYNPHTHVCCAGHVSVWKPWKDQSRGSPGQHCCGTELYWPQIEICCNGHRHPKAENVHCCGAQAYNIKNHHMKCCAGTLYNLTLSELGHTAWCCGSILQKPQDVCCSGEDKEVLYSAKTGFRCCGHLHYNTSLWSCCAGSLSPAQQPGRLRNRMTEEPRPRSVSNLKETDLCDEMLIGTVESVSLRSIVFSSVLKICGRHGTVYPVPSPYILKTPEHCNFPRLIPGKTYFFDEVNVFTDFNHDSILQSLYFMLSKCSHHQVTAG